MQVTLSELNASDAAQFVAVCGPLFENSAWIAERTASRRPFASLAELHQALCSTVQSAAPAEQLRLIRAHPDLVGRAAQVPSLTTESAREQAAAGLGQLSADEEHRLRDYNATYRQKFGFPFVICARENKKEAILAAFPARLTQSCEREMQSALAEIAKIAWLRLADAVEEG